MSHWSRSIPSFLLNIIKRLMLPNLKAKDIEAIYNYYRVPNLFETSGQPSKEELKLIAKKGYEVVINLAPNSMIEGSVINEREILERVNVSTYTYLLIFLGLLLSLLKNLFQI